MEKSLQLQLSKERLSALLNLNVVNFRIKSGGTSLGDNYLSNISCLEVFTENEPDNQKKIQLILKSFPTHPSRQDFLKKSNLFWKELSAYNQLIPTVQKTCRLELPFPKLYGGIAPNFWNSENGLATTTTIVAPTDALIILEDLRPKGFKMSNKHESLDFNHVCLVIEALAKFHASTWAYKQKKNLTTLHDEHDENNSYVRIGSKPEDQNIFDQIVVNNIQNLIDSFKAHGTQAYEQYAPNLKKFQKYVSGINEIIWTDKERDIFKLEKFHRNLDRRESQSENRELWKVGGHGDCWTNNVLFRYKDNDPKIPEEAILIDLQLVNESCPIIDLVYFIYISTDTEFRKEHLDSVLELYHEEFLNTCKILDVKPMNDFNLEELKFRFHVGKVFGFCTSMMVLPIILKEDEAEIDKAINLDEMMPRMDDVNVFESLTYVKNVQQEFKYMKRILDLVKELYEETVL